MDYSTLNMLNLSREESVIKRPIRVKKLLEGTSSFDELSTKIYADMYTKDTMFDSYANFFFKRFSSPYQNNLWDKLGVRVRWTSSKNEEEFGITNVLVDEAGSPVIAESRVTEFSNDEKFLLDENAAASLVFNGIANSIPPPNRILFTSLPGPRVFRKGLEAAYSQVNVLGSALQREFIETDSSFFAAFQAELNSAAKNAEKQREDGRKKEKDSDIFVGRRRFS